jgi:hypothetical protein
MSTEISTTTTPARGLSLATFEDAFPIRQDGGHLGLCTEGLPRARLKSCLLAIQHGSESWAKSPMQSAPEHRLS